jgi:hypothetical protein
VRLDHRHEARAVGEAQAPAHAAQALGIRRQGVGLAAVLELHAVLDATEEAIGVGQHALFAIGEQPRQRQLAQRRQRAALAQLPALAGVEQLQQLRHQLDVADAARAQLDVEARPLGAAAEQPPQRQHLVHGVRPQRAREHEGLDRLEEALPQRSITCGGPRAEQGLPLPGAAEGLVVALGRRQRVADGAAAPLGPQAQIDPEHHARVGALRERAGGELRQPGVVLVQGQAAGAAFVAGVEVDQIDVRGEVELLPPELAHAQHHEAGRPLG